MSGPLLARFFATCVYALLCVASQVVSAETALNAKTSWIGNTFGYGDGTWTQINITAIAVAPDGKVYTNAPWDEAGAEASVYQNGKVLEYAGGTHGWGNGGGNAVAVNHKYLFLAVAVGNERGHLVSPGIWPERASSGTAFRAARLPIPNAACRFSLRPMRRISVRGSRPAS